MFLFRNAKISSTHLYSVGLQPSFNSIALELWVDGGSTVVAAGSLLDMGAMIEAVSFSGAGLADEPLKHSNIERNIRTF